MLFTVWLAPLLSGVGVVVLIRLPIGVDIGSVATNCGKEIKVVLTPLLSTPQETANRTTKSDEKQTIQTLIER